MPQLSIGERIKFLLDTSGGSIRKFARMLDVSDTNIRNYIERGTKPSSDALERLVQNIPHLNPAWLLTGDGEPFLTDTHTDQSTTATVKKNSGVIGPNGTQLNIKVPGNLDDCKQQLAVLTAENEGLRSTVAALETALSAKEEILTLLRVGHTRPN